jgi:predicted adenine nucleotide alpha hydrolase (AANH) superfamily ATPase
MQNQLTKIVAFLYTNNEQIEKEYGKQFHLQYPQENPKYQGINLTKDVYDLCQDFYNPPKRLKKNTEGGKISHAHGLAEST